MNEQDWLDPHIQEIEEEFDQLWLTICDRAEMLGVTPSYVEEEFYIMGELLPLDYKVSPMFSKELLRRMRQSRDDNNDFKFKPRPGIM